MDRDGRVLFCFSAVAWHSIRMRPQQLMSRFADAGWDVHYVDPPLSFGDARKDPVLAKRAATFISAPADAPSVTVYSPLHVLPRRLPFHRLHRRVEECWKRRLVHALKAHCESRRCVAWIDRPEYLPLALGLDPSALIVYDCLDDYEAFSSVAEAQRCCIEEAERRLLRRADVVIGSSQLLVDRLKVRGAVKPIYVPNGADSGFFSGPAVAVSVVPNGTGRPAIGYVGALADWFDWALVKEVAESLPFADVVLVGPVQGQPHIPEFPSNVHMVGRVPYERLPGIMRGFSVAMIPFVLNDVTRATSPVKLFEYLAAGCPVVSTRLPELITADGPYRAVEREEFTAAVRSLIGSRTAESDSERRRWAAGHDWSARVEAAVTAIDAAARART